MVDLRQALVQQLDFIKGVHQLHLTLTIEALPLYSLHSIALIFKLAPCLHNFLSVTHITQRIVISAGTRLANIVVLLWISLHGDFSMTTTALEIEAVDFDT